MAVNYFGDTIWGVFTVQFCDLPRTNGWSSFVKACAGFCEMLSRRHVWQYCLTSLTPPLTGWGYTGFLIPRLRPSRSSLPYRSPSIVGGFDSSDCFLKVDIILNVHEDSIVLAR